jgi:UDP-N-acetyl-2-amino-2-deoxyglucuronate dehydrogenase
MSKINMAIVGCGRISHMHVWGLRLLREKGIDCIEIKAVCDPVKERATTLAGEILSFQNETPKIYSDIEVLLQNEDQLDAVDICTHHSTHHRIATEFMDHGKHAIVEKPLGITMRACRLMNEAANRNKVILATAENLRRSILNRSIKWALDEKMIGEPKLLIWQEVSYDLGIVDGTPWRHDKLKAGGGWILDVGSHIGDLLRYNMGEIEEIYGVVKILEPIRYHDWPQQKMPIRSNVEDASVSILKFQNGVLGQWNWTKSAPTEPLSHRAIYGKWGSINWKDGLKIIDKNGSIRQTFTFRELTKIMMTRMSKEEQERFFPKGLGTKLRSSFWGDDASFATELLDFANAIIEQRKPEVDGASGAKAQAVPLAIFESSFIGEPVKVSDVENCRIENYQMEINETLGLR